MNIQLAGTEEFIDGESKGSLGQVLIRFARPLSSQGGGNGKEKEGGQCRLQMGLKNGEPACGWDQDLQIRLTLTTRCNNVLWISGAKGEDVKMDG